jgi:hypothetical protein
MNTQKVPSPGALAAGQVNQRRPANSFLQKIDKLMQWRSGQDMVVLLVQRVEDRAQVGAQQ